MTTTRKHRGFTLIEMMIVVLIVTVLVSIIAMGTRRANQRAKEGTLLAGLKELRDAVQLFQNDVGGYPADLPEVTALDSSGVSGGADGAGNTRVPMFYNGPYLRVLPKDPMTNSTSWAYDNTTGEVHTTNSQTGADGRPYTEW